MKYIYIYTHTIINAYIYLLTLADVYRYLGGQIGPRWDIPKCVAALAFLTRVSSQKDAETLRLAPAEIHTLLGHFRGYSLTHRC